MKSITLEELLNAGGVSTTSGRIAIISSLAGGGNRSVGSALLRELSAAGAKAEHCYIEDLIGERAAAADFGRHHWICTQAPALLNLVYGFPVSYRLKLLADKLGNGAAPEGLERYLREAAVSTVIAANHRAAFWTASLLRRRKVNVKLVGVLTDYTFSPGWRYMHRDRLSLLIGAIPESAVPADVRARYRRTALPVAQEIARLSDVPGDRRHLLLTGGLWGLGPLLNIARELADNLMDTTIHLVCGENRILKQKADAEFGRTDPIRVYGVLESLAPLLSQCGAVISRPGGITLTEAFAAKRKIFLIPGLPVIEAENARYALQHFAAANYSLPALRAWRGG